MPKYRFPLTLVSKPKHGEPLRFRPRSVYLERFTNFLDTCSELITLIENDKNTFLKFFTSHWISQRSVDFNISKKSMRIEFPDGNRPILKCYFQIKPMCVHSSSPYLRKTFPRHARHKILSKSGIFSLEMAPAMNPSLSGDDAISAAATL